MLPKLEVCCTCPVGGFCMYVEEESEGEQENEFALF